MAQKRSILLRTELAENEFETAFVGVAIDSNGNGTYDPGVDEVLPGSGTTPILEPDQSATVFVITTVPEDVADQELSQVELTASAVTGSGTPGTVFADQGEGGGDAVAGTSTASDRSHGTLRAGITSVSLAKSVSFVDPFGEQSAVPGTLATYTLLAEVKGSGSIDDLIIADAIPEGTTYAAGTLSLVS